MCKDRDEEMDLEEITLIPDAYRAIEERLLELRSFSPVELVRALEAIIEIAEENRDLVIEEKMFLEENDDERD